MKLIPTTMAVAMLFSVVGMSNVQAAQTEADARKALCLKTFESTKDSVYQIKAVIKISINSDDNQAVNQQQEDKFEGLATCIDPNGLFVTSLYVMDKASALDGKEVNTPAGKIKLNAKSEISDIKVVLSDGTEIPAELVLKDGDQDLAFIKVKSDAPEAKDKKFKNIDLTKAEVPNILDNTLIISRMGKAYNNESSVLKTSIIGKVEKPRLRMRLPLSANPEFIGVPVMTEAGASVGLLVMGKMSSELSTGDNTPQPTVIPASDILKVAKTIEAKK